MSTRPAFALMVSLLMLNGCMMAGMAGMGSMGHGGDRDMSGSRATMPMRDPTIVKEVIDRDYRMTAEFPHYATGDSLIYSVTLRSGDGRRVEGDAVIFLTATATLDTSFRIKVAPIERAGGAFTFSPSIPRNGSYRMRVTAERLKGESLSPPLTLEQVVSFNASDMVALPTASSNHRRRWTTFAVVSTGVLVMSAMMLFSFR